MEIFHEILNVVVEAAILLFEYIGVSIIILSGICGVIQYIRKDPFTRLKLAKGMAMGLEFKLGSEILRTVVVREFSEILIVGSIRFCHIIICTNIQSSNFICNIILCCQHNNGKF